MGAATLVTLRRWGRRPLSERQIQYAAMDALVSVLIYDFIDARSGPFNESDQQNLHGVSGAFDNQSSAIGKHSQPSLGPDQRLPQTQSQPDSSASGGDAHVASDASQRPCADGPAVGEACLPANVASEIINLGRRHEGGSFHCGPGMRSTTISRDPSMGSRRVIPVQQMQKPPYQAPGSRAPSGLAGELPAVCTVSQTLPQMSSDSTSVRMCCMMSAVLQIVTKADPWTARAQRRLSSELLRPALPSHVWHSRESFQLNRAVCSAMLAVFVSNVKSIFGDHRCIYAKRIHFVSC